MSYNRRVGKPSVHDCAANQKPERYRPPEELVGGALSYAAAAVPAVGGVHIFVAEDRDAAAYLLNDFYNLLDERQVYFFPSS